MLADKFKVTIEFTTKDNFSIVELQRYFRNLLHNNGDIKVFNVKTEIKRE